MKLHCTEKLTRDERHSLDITFVICADNLEKTVLGVLRHFFKFISLSISENRISYVVHHES